MRRSPAASQHDRPQGPPQEQSIRSALHFGAVILSVTSASPLLTHRSGDAVWPPHRDWSRNPPRMPVPTGRIEVASRYPSRNGRLPEGMGWVVENVRPSTHNGTHIAAPEHYTSRDGSRKVGDHRRRNPSRVVLPAGSETRLSPPAGLACRGSGRNRGGGARSGVIGSGRRQSWIIPRRPSEFAGIRHTHRRVRAAWS